MRNLYAYAESILMRSCPEYTISFRLLINVRAANAQNVGSLQFWLISDSWLFLAYAVISGLQKIIWLVIIQTRGGSITLVLQIFLFFRRVVSNSVHKTGEFFGVLKLFNKLKTIQHTVSIAVPLSAQAEFLFSRGNCHLLIVPFFKQHLIQC